MTHMDILSVLVDFVSEDRYLFFAPVSRAWRAAWGAQKRPAVTRQAAADSSASQLEESLESGLPRDRVELSGALARHGHLELLELAREHGCAWGAVTCSAAAGAGELELLQWCKYNGCPWDDRTPTAAARNGHLEVVEWARKFGCDLSASTTAAAAGAGNLDLLKYLIEDGFPCSDAAGGAAAESGHLEILKYLVENDCCTLTEMTLLTAVLKDQLDVLEWALGLGDAFHFDTLGEYAFADAVQKGRLPVVQCLHRHGCPWNEASCLVAAVEGGHQDIALWIRENRRS